MNVIFQNKKGSLFIYPEGAHIISINPESKNIFSSAGNVLIEGIIIYGVITSPKIDRQHYGNMRK